MARKQNGLFSTPGRFITRPKRKKKRSRYSKKVSVRSKRWFSNPLPLVAAEALESSTFTPYQNEILKEARQIQKQMGLKLNRSRKNSTTTSDVRSPTSTSTEVRSPTKTSTSTDAYTSGNVTVTGGAGRGANTRVSILQQKPAGPKKGVRANPRRNPSDQAADVYEGLHGRPSSEVVEIITQIHEHQHVASYGELVALFVIPERGRGAVKLSGFETRKGHPAYLTTNEGRTQLFVDGGDQAVKLSVFGIKAPIHETEVLGELQAVDYYTTKDHLGSQGGEAVYHHTFSKRRRPVVIYDTVNRLLYLAGGRYENLDEGITN